MNQNFGPFETMPGTPWFRDETQRRSSTVQPAPTFTIAQTVTVKSKFSANPGVLTSGRRPEKPGG